MIAAPHRPALCLNLPVGNDIYSAHLATANRAGRPGRNDSCPCASGRKYKHCCLLRTATSAPITAEAVRREVAAQVELGHTLFRLGRVEEAAGALSRAVSIDPAHLQAQTNLGAALARLGRMAEAEAALRKALELNSRYAPAHTNLGELLRTGGRMAEARESLESALRLAPQDQLTRLAYADVLHELGEFESAGVQYREVISRGPGSSRIYSKLGLALLSAGDRAGALDAVRTAVRLDPNSADAHIACAYALLQFGDVHEAITCAEGAVRLARHPLGHMLHGVALAILGNLGDGIARFRVGLGEGKSAGECMSAMAALLQQLGHADSARECLSHGLEIEPHNPMLLHEVAALSGEAPERASDEYVAQFFDTFAKSFDRHLLGRLMYTAPRLVRDAILAARSGQLDVLDLGCGTGLVGVELSSHARSLVGVDLSEKMLQIAGNRNIYTRLVRDDLGSALRAESESSYDVVAAADVFVYVGRLDEVLPAVHRVLRPQGAFVFTVEADSTEHADHPVPSLGYRLTSTGRFAHTAGYLTDLAAHSALEIKTVREVRLRSETLRPVAGLLLVLVRAA